MRSFLPLLCLLGVSNAHSAFTNFFINGESQGDGTCVRMSQTPDNATSPLPFNVAAPEMACGVDGDIGVARVCNTPAGALMTFEFRERPDGKAPGEGAIDKSHKGPVAVYMKKVADPTANGTAAGDGWFKIFQADFNATSQQWATEMIIANKGLLSVQLPKSIAGGYYLVRSELLALHEADKSPPDPQFYVGCAQIFLQGGGTSEPTSKVKIPGYISAESNKAALTFNIYNKPMALPYPMFGPPVFVGTPTTNQKAVVKAASVNQSQTIGLKPNDCVLANGNWCGRELASFTTEQGCWNASTACWAQCKDCYSSSGPTGSANCQIWENKCKAIQAQCNAGNFNGPPNHMKDLTPKNKAVQVPPPAVCAQSNKVAEATTPQAATASTSYAESSVSRQFTLQIKPTASASTPAAATGAVSYGTNYAQTKPTASAPAAASSRSNYDTTTTVKQTTFQTVTKSDAAPVASGDANGDADSTTTIHSTSFKTVIESLPAATPSSQYAASSPAAAGAGSPSAAASPSIRPNIGPDAFGSLDKCGAANASAHCGAALCCSQFNQCGATPQHCGIGCQDVFGACDQLPANVTVPNATGGMAGEAEASCTEKKNGASATAAATSTSAAAATGAAASSSYAVKPQPSANANAGADAGVNGPSSAAAAATTSKAASTSSTTTPTTSASTAALPPAPKLPIAKPTGNVTVVVLAADHNPKLNEKAKAVAFESSDKYTEKVKVKAKPRPRAKVM